MKNKLTDLNDHLFAQLERLGDETLGDEKLKTEIERSKAITSIAKNVVENAALMLDAAKLKAEYQGLSEGDLPGMLYRSTKPLETSKK
ncbi:hypothetical protein TDB9533_01268 [Thalassocella blandensis]|nr:hypothetical protein TDB9533_01268 [Thalassocella blandensis]